MVTNYKEIIEAMLDYILATSPDEKRETLERLYVLQGQLESVNHDINDIAEEAVTLAGVPHSLRGYRFCVDAIIIAVNRRECTEDLTKVIYPQVAKIHRTTSASVERCIRTAVEKSIDRCDCETYSELFGNSYYAYGWRPTNKEFIATLAEYVKRRLR